MRERAVAAYVDPTKEMSWNSSILFSRGIDEGRRLMASRGSQSYAAELEVLSKDEVGSIRHLEEYFFNLWILSVWLSCHYPEAFHLSSIVHAHWREPIDDWFCLQLMSKLREQFTINDRLREYIERMLTVIIENSPQLLEVTMNMGMPIGMSATAATSQPGPTLIISSKELEQTTLPSPQPLTATDSSKSDPATTTAKPSNDKYCRL